MPENQKTLKIAIGYPPIESSKGTPLLSQNRQFQFFNDSTYIYPMVPAYAASLLKKNGYKVFWMDGIAEQQTFKSWLEKLKSNSPGYLMIETKSPVIKTHWSQIDEIKKEIPEIKIILVGDHVTTFPEESFENSKVDYIIKGGDYDFVVLKLLNHIKNGERLEGGIYWRAEDKLIKSKPVEKLKVKGRKEIHNSGPMALRHNLDELPFVDRDLTKWKLYAYENGNYKYKPGTYMYSGRDCWWNRCTFCVWDHTLNPVGSYRSFSPARLFAEVKHVVDNYGVKEIFDDAGTLAVGPWLKTFCNLLIDSGYSKKVVYGCNMRLNALTQEYYDLMGKANFRFILYGMESGNQYTLDKLDKGVKVHQIEEGVRMAKKAGLDPHLTIMLGYPWETYEMAKNTIALAKRCFDKGYVDTMQATIVIPYPGTPLWKECGEKGWLLTEDYEEYDMRKAVMKSPLTNEQILELTQELYSSFFTPRYMLRRALEIRTLDDIKYLYYSAWKLVGHLLDFDPNQTKVNVLSPKFWVNAFKSLAKTLFPSKADKTVEKSIKESAEAEAKEKESIEAPLKSIN